MRTTASVDEHAWGLARRGHHVAVLGRVSLEPPAGWRPAVIRVRCQPGGRELAPLVDASRKINGRLGDPIDARGIHPMPELRQRLLDEEHPRSRGDAFVRAANRLAHSSPNGAVLVLEAAEHADPPTAAYLSRLLLGPGLGRHLGLDVPRLSLPIVLTFGSQPIAEASLRLIEAVRASGGAVLSMPPATALVDTDALARIPVDVLRVLRAGAELGDAFSVPELAAAIGLDPVEVLEALQVAADGGIAIEDDGDLNIRLPSQLAEALRDSVLPSFARLRSSRPPVRATELEPRHPVDLERRTGAPPSMSPGRDTGAAAALAAAERAASVGGLVEALQILERALESRGVGGAEVDVERLERAELLLAKAGIHFLGSAPKARLSLGQALDAVEEARALLVPSDPSQVFARVAVLLGHIAYDHGDPAVLDAALDALTDASRRLLTEGKPREAARLLNDQAAIYIRMGDAPRAVHLLDESRKVFAERADMDPASLRETAETDHLLARIPLHVPSREGQQIEAVAAALEHAKRAEGAFKRLGDPLSLARVWETEGRLHLLAGRADQALPLLTGAAQSQERIGDAVGLAKTTAAMADLFERSGRADQALGLLGASVRLNRLKGSPLGLAMNRRSLAALGAHLAAQPGLRAAYLELDDALFKAERELGHVGLPGESDADVARVTA